MHAIIDGGIPPGEDLWNFKEKAWRPRPHFAQNEATLEQFHLRPGSGPCANSGRSRAPPSVRGVPCARMEGKDEHKDEGEAPLDAEVDEEPAIIDWPAALEQVIGCSPPLARARG